MKAIHQTKQQPKKIKSNCYDISNEEVTAGISDAPNAADISDTTASTQSSHSHHFVLRHGLKKNQEFLGLYSLLRTLFPRRSSTFGLSFGRKSSKETSMKNEIEVNSISFLDNNVNSNSVSKFDYYIRSNKVVRYSGAVSLVLLFVLVFNTMVPIYNSTEVEQVNATTTTETLTPGDTSISITADDSIILPLIPNSSYGTFNSNTSTVSVTATNPGGYTLSLATGSSSADNTSLVNNDDGTNKFVSITENITTTAFSQDNSTGAALNGKWGYLFYKSGASGAELTTFKPSPSTGSTASLDASGTQGTTNYTLGIGARAGLDLPAGTYSNTFILTATANPISYTITLKLNNGTTDNYYVQDGATYGTTIELYSTAPTRDDYNFLGWCSETTSDETCSGTTYQPGDSFPITGSGVAATLYAMWERNGKTITSATYMQDFATDRDTIVASMTVNQQYQLTDNRDNKTYYISKVQTSCSNPRVTAEADGKCYQVWMTQNLDLDLVATPDFYTHNNTDLGWDPSAFNESKTWTANAATSTTRCNGTSSTFFCSYNPGDVYYYTSGSTNNDGSSYSSSACTGLTTAECQAHYHAGNYYTWNAAVANNLSDTQYNVRPDSICPAGWKLPTGATSSNGYTDFNYLLVQQSVIGNSYNTNGSSISYASGGFNKIRTAPLFFVRSGDVDSGSLLYDGRNGYYWSSSVYSSSLAYYLFFDGSSVYPANYDRRYVGFSVRCVARNPGYTITFEPGEGGTGTMSQQVLEGGTTATLSSNAFTRDGYILDYWLGSDGNTYTNGQSITAPASGGTLTLTAQWKQGYYIQDFAKATCQKQASSGNVTVYDRRDGNDYTVRYINNNCWMTQNLRITNTTGQAEGVILGTDSAFSATSITMTKGTSFNSYTTAQFYPGQASGGATAKQVGAWYSFCAAAAKSGTGACASSTYSGSESICPKNWRLPTKTEQDGITSYAGAFNPIYGGYWYDGSLYYATTYGSYWWSSTAYSTYSQYSLSYYSGSLGTASLNDKFSGYYVRCIRST